MTQLYRRTWEKKQFGRAGALSSVLSARSGTDGVIAGSSFAAPVAVLTSASASFAATDVGRLITLTGTPSRRYDGQYIVDVFTNSTTVSLRCNHNTGAPTSAARFMENGTSIAWRLSETATFTADSAGDFAATDAGSYIAIEGAASTANNGVWKIVHFTDNQHVQLSKSWLFYITDVTTNAFQQRIDGADFVTASSLQWSLTDREPINMMDAYMMMRQFFIDCGWSLWQNRGPYAISSAANNLFDDIFRTVGETDATNLPDGRIAYLRLTTQLYSRTTPGVSSSAGLSMFPGLWLSWDPTQTATIPGNGLAALRGSAEANNDGVVSSATPSSLSSPGSSVFYALDTSTGGVDMTTTGRLGSPMAFKRQDLVMHGDADEVTIYLNGSLVAGNQAFFCVSSLVQSGNNKFSCAIQSVTGSGASAAVNTGSVDLSTKGYAVGDRVTIRGLSPTTNVEYLETTTITAFTNTGGVAPFGVTVANLSRTYGNGTYDTKKGYIGNDPFPHAILEGTTSAWNIRFHNAANLGNGTGKDYDSTNHGSPSGTGTLVNALPLTSLTPNYRSGNIGLVAYEARNDSNNEFRGRLKYLWCGNNVYLPQGKKLLDPVNSQVYIALCIGNVVASSITTFIGPMSKTLAGVR